VAKPKGEDYPVGFGKPPKESQFEKGKSGNPKGRPKARKSVVGLFLDTINRKVAVNEDGARRSITKLEAIFTQTINKAAAGNLRAVETTAKILRLLDLLKIPPSQQVRKITLNIPPPPHLRTAEDQRRYEETASWKIRRKPDDKEE
jgi:hypothetical protein